jgi:Tol biopolymer transport system component
MRVASVVVSLILLAGCSGSGSGAAVGSVVDAAGSPVVASPTAGSATGSSVDLTSPSGRIVFDNHDDVWTINADGTGARLTRASGPGAHEFDPTLSPDRRLIAYRRERDGGNPEIWLMHADGTGQHRLTGDGGFPTWSPDGSMIAYAPAGGPSGMSWIAIMNADGSGQRRLPHTDGGEYPSWSPDGKRIAFNSNLSGSARMYVVDVDGSRVVDLSSVGEGGQVAWSPDGRSILFASHRDHTDDYRDIYVMRPDGSGVKRLTHANGETPAWSPDGRYIVFAAAGLFVMRADGSGVISLPVGEAGEATFPDWR